MMEDLEYRVRFADGTYGMWHRRDAKELGAALLVRLELAEIERIVSVEVRRP